ncbi:MAG TPA: hypothetical protein VJR23_11555 [Candidatus Acidoferrales bacterium]|nr:hypothetical protein [Candidatus Acidoferrales bacterium]
MFCPVCKAEYRLGFTECSDCGVPLVENLDDPPAPSGEPAGQESGELLWTGTQTRLFSEICRALDDAHLPYHKASRDVGPLPGLKQSVFAVFVHRCDHEAAKAVLEDLQRQREFPPLAMDEDADQIEPDESHDQESEIPSPDENESSAPANQSREFVPEDFISEDATAEVWSGSDRGMADGLAMCLRENGIGSAVTHDAGTTRVSVHPADEPRAREIIREVVDAAPPQ